MPVLFALWVLAGLLFPFSPHQLTHTLPAFLLGADDWGVGNIYTYTKLADWVALLAGCAACAHLANENTTVEQGFIKRLRLCFPHLIAARIEVWFRPDSDKPERKLLERICKIEGWQR